MRVAADALPAAAVLVAATVALGWLIAPWAAIPPLVLLLFLLWFFRDPERSTPQDALGVFSPADGRIVRADGRGVSVFMNLFDVHVCRAPVSGSVEQVLHRPGRFLAAYRDGASLHNERTIIELREGERRLTFTLVAGLVARRIVCKVRPGQRLRAGERIGLIRFGSRVDVALPPGARPTVRPGERVIAGVSVVARLAPRSGEPAAL